MVNRHSRATSLNDDEMKNLDKLIKKKPTAIATELANDIFQDTDKRVSDRTIRRYRRALGYRSYHQSVKKSLTPVQEQSKLLFSQHYMNSKVKKWLFCDETIFTMQRTGTIA